MPVGKTVRQKGRGGCACGKGGMRQLVDTAAKGPARCDKVMDEVVDYGVKGTK